MGKYKIAKLLIIFFVLLCIGTSTFYGDRLLLGSFSKFNNDDVKYLRSAEVLINTGKLTYTDSEQPTVFIMPGIILFLAPFVKIFGMRDAIFFVRIMQAIIQGITLYLIFKIYIKLFDEKIALLGLVLNLAYLPNIYITTIILTETIFTFLFTWCVYYLIDAIEYKENKKYFASGIFFASAAMFRPSIALLPIIVFFIWLIYKYTFKEMASFAVIALIPVAVIFMPWWIRNYVEFNRFIPFTLSSGNPMLQGMFINNNVDYKLMAELNDENFVYTNDEINNNYIESKMAQKVFKHNLAENPWQYIKWLTIGKTLANIKSPYYGYSLYGVSFETVRITHLILITASIFGMIISNFKGKYLIIGAFIYFLAIHIPFLSYSRYLYPVIPMIIPMAGNLFLNKAR